MNKRVKRDSCVVCVLALCGILFYLLNYYSPLYGDDYSYSFSFADGNRIETFIDILKSQYAHYFVMNGRAITHMLAQLFLMIDKDIFNIVNTISFLALIYLLCLHIVGSNKKIPVSVVILVACFIFICTPAFGQSYLWITGASNYLYGPLIVFAFLFPYRFMAEHKKQRLFNWFREIGFAVFFFAFGIIAGWTNENNAVAVISVSLTYVILNLYTKNKIHIWNITGVVGSVIGTLFMLLSPGNAIRSNNAGGFGGIFTWIKRGVLITCKFVEYFSLPLSLLILLLIMLYIQNPSNFTISHFKNKLSISIPFWASLVGLLSSTYSMIVSPYFPDRAWTGPLFFLLILIGQLYVNVDCSDFRLFNFKQLMCICMIVLCISAYITGLMDVKNVDMEQKQRVSNIKSGIEKDELDIYTASIKGTTRFSCYSKAGDLSIDYHEWPNADIAKYYGVHSIHTK